MQAFVAVHGHGPGLRDCLHTASFHAAAAAAFGLESQPRAAAELVEGLDLFFSDARTR